MKGRRVEGVKVGKYESTKMGRDAGRQGCGLQGYRETRIQGCRVTGRQGYKVTRIQGYRDAG
jgi:hypothetical protein